MMTVNMTALNITELLLTHPRFLGGTSDAKLTLESVSKVASEASDDLCLEDGCYTIPR